MTSLRFNPDSTSKTLNLSLLRFNERSEFQNLDQNKASEMEIVPLNHGSPSQILGPSFEPQTGERGHHASNFIIIEGGGGNI